jgi:hypothetical protein
MVVRSVSRFDLATASRRIRGRMLDAGFLAMGSGCRPRPSRRRPGTQADEVSEAPRCNLAAVLK